MATICTSFSCQGQNDTQNKAKADTLAIKQESNAAPVELGKPVKVGNSKPTTFKGTKPNIITRKEKLYPFFDTLLAMQRPTRIVHIGDSHVRGHSFTVEARKRLEKEWGAQAVEPQVIEYKTTALATETGKPGLVYHAFGKNGATCLDFTTNEYIQKIVSLKPDMIIISFGTNECHVKKYDPAPHRKALDKMLKLLNDSCPNAIIVMTTPGGAHFSKKRTVVKAVKQKNGKTINKKVNNTIYIENPSTATCVNTITTFAKENDLAVWDMFYIGGGKEFSTKNWVNNRLMKKDYVHYTLKGYKIQGDLLAEAILRAYNDYLKNKSNGGNN